MVGRAAYAKEGVVLKRREKGLATPAPPKDVKRIEDAADAVAGRKALAEFRNSGKKAIPLREVRRRLGI
jgi:hypothetical protein